MLKQGIKTTNAEFIRTCRLFQRFFVPFRLYAFRSVQTLWNLSLRASSLFDVNVKK